MAQLARLEFTIQATDGEAVSGASIEVRRQGAQVFGNQAGPNLTTINVDSPGAVVAGDTVAINTGTTTRTVSSITATTVVVGGLGFPSVSDDDRVTIATVLPTIYEDAEAATSTTNPLTTDSLGYASCFVVGGKYDVKISGGGQTTRLIQDVAAVGGETNRSTVFMSGSATAWTLDTLRAAGVGDRLLSVQTAASEKFSIRGDGEIVAGAAGATHALTGDLSVSGAATFGSVSTLNITGNLTTGRILGRNGSTVDTGDIVISSGWGNTAILTVSALSTDTRGALLIECQGSGIGANPFVTYTYADGTFTTAPVFITTRYDIAAPLAASWNVDATSPTSTLFYFTGTPVSGSTYAMAWATLG